MEATPFDTRTSVSIQDRTIPVRIAGRGRPILLLHGFPLDNRMWDQLIPLLSSKLLCIAPDLRGFGQSAEERLSFSIADLADDCARLLNQLQVRQPCIICGLSMGGYVAMEFVERHPAQVARVILTNTRCNADDPLGIASRLAMGSKAIRDGVEPASSPMFAKLLSSETISQQPKLADLVRTMMQETKASTVAWAQLAMANRTDFFGKMRSWNLPADCIGGSEDSICPPETIQRMHATIPDSQMHIIHGSAHLTPLECPNAFADIVTQQHSTANYPTTT